MVCYPSAMLHSPKISNRSLLSDPDVVPHAPDEEYADALRRNAFNLSVNEKSGYGKTGHPPPPPSRTVASSGNVSGGMPPEMFYNLTPPADLSYPTYPNGSATSHHPSPHRNPTYVSGEYRPPVLSTFSTSPHSPVSMLHPAHPSTPTRTVPPELDGHLVWLCHASATWYWISEHLAKCFWASMKSSLRWLCPFHCSETEAIPRMRLLIISMMT